LEARVDRRRADLQDALVSIGLNLPLESTEPARRGNHTSALASPEAMAARFAEHPEAVAETGRVAERLRFDLTTDLGYGYPGADDPGADRELAETCGRLLDDRYPGSPLRAEAEGRLRELAVIRHLRLGDDLHQALRRRSAYLHPLLGGGDPGGPAVSGDLGLRRTPGHGPGRIPGSTFSAAYLSGFVQRHPPGL